ncbi:hypothetical protein N9260_00480 [bacterium]|nr:hypothetical protein [bacterium]
MRLGISLAAGVVCIALGACNKRDKEASTDVELSEIQIQKEAEQKERDEKRAAAVKRSKEAMRQGKAPNTVESQSTEKQDRSEEEWKKIEDKMLTRYLAVGEKIGSITIGDETFEHAAIGGVDRKGLTITHKTGGKDLLYTDLPAGLRAKMLVDESETANISRGIHLPKLPRARAKAVRDRVVEARKTLRPTLSPTPPPNPAITEVPSKPEENPHDKARRITDQSRKKAALAVRDAEYQLDELKERLIELREGGVIRRSQNDSIVRKAAKIVQDKEARLKRLKEEHQTAQEVTNQARDEQLKR